ncbi:hypothetical protein NSK_005700 [Nannochloropsis salina CCMP1776]|uniref:Glucose-methanol-choline oxidoreductase C-terminal domain-containing protein n=1 Tax=Nannochloropsis salina CCMP1776 TaxID=1027361 RepID=A0A4D9CUT7_9STRA|nr:hypothetical protein NSK_005700 [Nannochloropsis salina CCMP1776]|eukprot:TFJ83012.1 hypothetical protein NSK_005700 [Nannochloropsis salina CCMP1776]
MAPLVGRELLPGRLYDVKASLTVAFRYGRAFAGSYYHPASSCRLGKVVDKDLHVVGVAGLRIADASILPRLGSAGPLGACLMVGDRAGRLLVQGGTRARGCEEDGKEGGREGGRAVPAKSATGGVSV